MSTDEHGKGRSRTAGPKLFLVLVVFIAVAIAVALMLSPIHLGSEPNFGAEQPAVSR
ncbi:MAG TPA: hypothetical protein VGC07_09040 [Granulicella sp.]